MDFPTRLSGFLRVSDHTALDIHACPFRACENTTRIQKLNAARKTSLTVLPHAVHRSAQLDDAPRIDRDASA